MSSLNIAARALSTNLSALQVVGHNISNVNTEGYSRQTVQLQTAGYQLMGGSYFGKGVQLESVRRSYDGFLTSEAQLTRSIASGDQVRFEKLQQLENLFPMGDTGLGGALNASLNAWSDVASSPTDLTARLVVLSRAEEVVNKLHDTTARLDELRQSSTLHIDSTVQSINMLAVEIAGLNQRIAAAQGESPNDLLDARDKLIGQLNDYVQTTTVKATDGTLSVFVAGSQALVLGTRAAELQAVRDELDPIQVRIDILQAGVPTRVNDDFLRGGQLEGLLNFVNKDLPDSYNSLGRLALSLGEQINAQHRMGLDLYGNPGGDFYTLEPLPDGYAATTNTGTATVSVAVSDATKFVASDYEVRFTSATDGTIVRLSDGTTTAFNAGAPLPMVVDGLTFNVSAGAANFGDRFKVRPFAEVSRQIELALSSPHSVAASSQLLVDVDPANSGAMALENISAIEKTSANYPPIQITYNATTGSFDVYDVTTPATPVLLVYNPTTQTFAPGAGPGSGWVPYSPGQPLTFSMGGDTWRINLRGVPANGDNLTIRQPAAGESMRQTFGNARAILDLRAQDSFEGVSLGDGYISVFSMVASKVQSGKFAAEFSSTSATQAETARSNLAGVNLDEEAAKLIQYQQSYQASAKFLQVVQGTFDTLMSSFAR